MFTGASVELKTCNAALLETTGKSWAEVGLFAFMNFMTLLFFVTQCFNKFNMTFSNWSYVFDAGICIVNKNLFSLKTFACILLNLWQEQFES